MDEQQQITDAEWLDRVRSVDAAVHALRVAAGEKRKGVKQVQALGTRKGPRFIKGLSSPSHI